MAGKKLMAFLAGAAALSACGGGGDGGAVSPGSGAVTRAEVQSVVVPMADRFERYSEAAYTQLPASGSSRYTGYAVLVNDADDSGYIGRATLDANFARETISGEMRDFTHSPDGNRLNSSRVASGRLTLSDGQISNSGGAARIDTDVSGTLREGGDTYVVDGSLFGGFGGDAADPVKGVALAPDSDFTTKVNGSEQPYDLVLIGER